MKIKWIKQDFPKALKLGELSNSAVGILALDFFRKNPKLKPKFRKFANKFAKDLAEWNESGPLPVVLRFDYSMRSCTACNAHNHQHLLLSFCSIKCLQQYLEKNEIEEKGFLCKSCKSTGFAFGYETNGPCEVCKGQKRIK